MKDTITARLKEEAKQFITHNKLVLNGVEIYPKEIEVYYYKEGEFEDKSVHRNELQMNHKNYFYVHRCKNSDSYKGGNRAGLDFVVSDDEKTYYSYLIRSAVINGQPFYGPNNVLNAIKSACGCVEYADLEKQVADTVPSDIKYDGVVYTTRIGLSDKVDAYFRGRTLRLVVLDNDFKKAQYKAKENIVLDYLKQTNSTKAQAEVFCKEYLTYMPSQITKFYATNNNPAPLLTDLDTDTVYFSNYLPKECPNLYKNLKQILTDNNVDFRMLKYTEDIWCRDYMPIQTGDNRFVSYKYFPNYLNDAENRKFITNVKKVGNIDFLKWGDNVVDLDLIIDGGNVVKCGNKIVMTEKVFVENKDKSRDDVQKMLTDAFQCEIVFIPWDREEIYGHSDGVIHYLGGNRILMTNYEQFDADMTTKFRRVLDEHFDVVSLKYDVEHLDKNSWAYINYLQIGKLVLVPQLGIPEDQQALQQIRAYLPECNVIGVPDAMEAVDKDGALNCISWNIKAPDANQKFIEDYHKQAKRVVREQQKQPSSFEEARRQTAIINGYYDGDK